MSRRTQHVGTGAEVRRVAMLRTSVCDLLGIEFPIIQAGMGPFVSAELVAAVSNAGALGSIGAGARTPADLQKQLERLRDLTDRPYAINHVFSGAGVNPESFELTLAAKPRLVSFALGDPGDYVK